MSSGPNFSKILKYRCYCRRHRRLRRRRRRRRRRLEEQSPLQAALALRICFTGLFRAFSLAGLRAVIRVLVYDEILHVLLRGCCSSGQSFVANGFFLEFSFSQMPSPGGTCCRLVAGEAPRWS